MAALLAPSVTLDVKLTDTVIQTWFERDRAHVCLSRKDRDGEAGDTIVEWWDEAVGEAVEDGFLRARDWHGSAFENASQHGMLTPLKIDFSEGWPSIVMAFVRHTPSSERPAEQSDRLEWYGEMAAEIAESVLKDRQFAKLSPRQAETVAETLTGALYEVAISAERRPAPLRLDTSLGTLLVETDGETIVARGGNLPSCEPFALTDGTKAFFTLTWKHADDVDGAKLEALFGRTGEGLRTDGRLAKGLSTAVHKALVGVSDDVADLVLATREWNALTALERTIKAGQDNAPEVKAAQRIHDDARAARAAARIHVEELHGPAPAMA